MKMFSTPSNSVLGFPFLASSLTLWNSVKRSAGAFGLLPVLPDGLGWYTL